MCTTILCGNKILCVAFLNFCVRGLALRLHPVQQITAAMGNAHYEGFRANVLSQAYALLRAVLYRHSYYQWSGNTRTTVAVSLPGSQHAAEPLTPPLRSLSACRSASQQDGCLLCNISVHSPGTLVWTKRRKSNIVSADDLRNFLSKLHCYTHFHRSKDLSIDKFPPDMSDAKVQKLNIDSNWCNRQLAWGSWQPPPSRQSAG